MVTSAAPARPLASQTLFRGLDILDAVAAGCLTVQAIADRTGMAFSTTHRLASALVQARYLNFEPRRGYRLGSKLLELGFAAYQDSTITSCARPYLTQLAADTQDTVHLAILDEGYVVYLDKLDGQRPVQVNSRIGGRKPVCSTGVGKALILDEPQAQWLARLDAEVARGEPPSDAANWLAAMQRYAAGGYAMDLEENGLGIRCVAAPIRDLSQHIVAAVSVTGTAAYTSLERMQQLIPVVQQTAARISAELGYRS